MSRLVGHSIHHTLQSPPMHGPRHGWPVILATTATTNHLITSHPPSATAYSSFFLVSSLPFPHTVLPYPFVPTPARSPVLLCSSWQVTWELPRNTTPGKESRIQPCQRPSPDSSSPMRPLPVSLSASSGPLRESGRWLRADRRMQCTSQLALPYLPGSCPLLRVVILVPSMCWRPYLPPVTASSSCSSR